MLKKERENYILRMLSQKSSVSVSELSDALGLSEVTVRKLLLAMEREGLIRRIWGGATRVHTALTEPTYDEKRDLNKLEKMAIAQVAYDLIRDGDAVFLDSGTTTVHLAYLLASGNKRKTLVCTNAINIACELVRADDMQVILIGGEFRQHILSCTGSMAREALKTLRFDKGFLSGNHFSVEHGFTTPSLQEAEIKRAVLSACRETFMLIDYSKYGNDSFSQIAPCESAGGLITDWHAPPDVLARFVDRGMRVYRAQAPEGDIQGDFI